MDIKKSDRSTLKSYFVKNAMPTSGNFADLVEGMINQKEDGIAKLAGEPLSLQADGDNTSQKKAINFYKSFADPQPAWTLSLNPRTDPNNPATARPGLSFGDAAGNSKLFIDQSTGNVGMGTANPGGYKLNVAGPALFTGNYLFVNSENAGRLRVGAAWGMPGLYSSDDGAKPLSLGVAAGQKVYLGVSTGDAWIEGGTGDGYFRGSVGIGAPAPRAKLEVRDGAIMPSAGNSAAAGIQFSPDPGGGGGDAAWLRFYARSGESCTLELGISNDADDHIALMPSGNVGIGTNTPAGKLDVFTGGAGAWNRFVVKTTAHWGDGDTQYVTIGEGGASGIMFYNPHVVWFAPENRASIRMGRSGGVAGGHWWDIGVRANNMFSILDGQTGATGLSLDAAGNATIQGNLGTHGYPSTPAKAGWGGGIRTWDVEAHGSVWAQSWVGSGNRDLAENFAAAQTLGVGEVVCIDPETDGVRRSQHPGDPLVLGIVSAQPGLLLGAERDACGEALPGQYPIALTGRVPCRVVAENGRIRKGDLVTSSSTAGHAMKALPEMIGGKPAYRPGTLIGKALESMDADAGTIDIFVFIA